MVERNIRPPALVPLVHKALDAPDDLVAVEWRVAIGFVVSVADIMLHIRP